MTELRTEALALLTGLIFSIAVFAFKTAVGEFYWLSGNFRRKTRIALLAGTSAAYLLLWSAAGAAVTLVRENPVTLFYHSRLFQGGAALHLLSAAGFLIWAPSRRRRACRNTEWLRSPGRHMHPSTRSRC